MYNTIQITERNKNIFDDFSINLCLQNASGLNLSLLFSISDNSSS